MDRRSFLRQSLCAAALPVVGGEAFKLRRAPALVVQEGDRPQLPQGVASGEVSDGEAVVWSRADRPARMFVEYATSDKFTNVRRVRGPAAIESSDFTARVVLTGLPPGQRIFYRVLFQDLVDIRRWSLPTAGSFVTPAPGAQPRDVTLAWSADTVGQGWGINTDWGGLRLYEVMRRQQPDVFLHLGDTIYGDSVLPSEIKLDDGSTWKNIVTPAKSKVAETLEEYRGNYQYNLLDEHMRRFNAEVSQVVIWDDHEVRDNWYTERDLQQDDRYQVRSAALLAARARQAFFEYNPLRVHAEDPERLFRTLRFGPLVETFVLDLRSYRGPNSDNRQPALDERSALAGASQMEAIKARLAASRATWKVIAASMPIGLVVRDGPLYEAIANGDAGAPLGRELEIADLLRFIRDRRIQNVVWVTGDVHYCAAHHYDPARAKFTEFAPFWEFVAGPLHAGTFGPNELDPTFGPEVRFNGVKRGMKGNRGPSEGLQFFGTLAISARTRVMTAKLFDLSGKTLFSVDLPPTR